MEAEQFLMKHTTNTQPWPFPYQFIAIEGNIGAGKTTLTRMIAKDYGCQLVLEQFADNPFLPYFYDNPERHAFTVELFFMTERHKQLQEELAQQRLIPATGGCGLFLFENAALCTKQPERGRVSPVPAVVSYSERQFSKT